MASDADVNEFLAASDNLDVTYARMIFLRQQTEILMMQQLVAIVPSAELVAPPEPQEQLELAAEHVQSSVCGDHEQCGHGASTTLPSESGIPMPLFCLPKSKPEFFSLAAADEAEEEEEYYLFVECAPAEQPIDDETEEEAEYYHLIECAPAEQPNALSALQHAVQAQTSVVQHFSLVQTPVVQQQAVAAVRRLAAVHCCLRPCLASCSAYRALPMCGW